MLFNPCENECAALKVHDQEMKRTNAEKYLGDIVSSTGNWENIENRRKLGMKTISEILSILKEIGIGCHYLKIGIIYRDAALKCKMLLNSEVWHSLTVQQVSLLENVDKTYLMSILRCYRMYLF